jgi:hypothetical protein
MRHAAILTVLLCGMLVGCTSFHAVETTPEGIFATVEPGDTVRILMRDGSRMDLMVWSISYEEIRGRTQGRGSEVVRVRFDTIDTLQIERLSLRKTLLSTVVPVVLTAVLVCSRRECNTGAVVVSRH